MSDNNVLLIILDGFGYRKEIDGNAIAEARTPFLTEIAATYPHRLIDACGVAVGLPEGTQGNSEVGHLNMGAGRVVPQDISKIDLARQNGEFQHNEAILSTLNDVSSHDGDLHIMGLISDGGVHSHIRHLETLVPMVADNFTGNVFIHAITDGRDTPPDSGVKYIAHLTEFLLPYPKFHIATVLGRFYIMDRDHRWERVERAYNALVNHDGIPAESAVDAVRKSYEGGVTDEFIKPASVILDSQLDPRVKDGDGIIFFNFRSDRAREITSAFVSDDSPAFDRKKIHDLTFCGFTLYQEDLPIRVAFPDVPLKQTLVETLSGMGIKVYKTAETEKYAHVTYFFNGGNEGPFPGETWKLINSPKVETYDLQPEMSASLVAGSVIDALMSGAYGLIVVNFANPDMVGHTGIEKAAITAIETVDKCLSRIWEAKPANFEIILTADHGNAEMMHDYSNGGPHTSHTLNPVPVFVLNKIYKLREGDAALKDIAPTVLDIMRLPKPPLMTGESLITR